MLKAFGRNAWVLPANEDEAGILDKLFRNSVKLCDIASVKNGIQTSANDVFLISEYEKAKGCIHFERATEECGESKRLLLAPM